MQALSDNRLIIGTYSPAWYGFAISLYIYNSAEIVIGADEEIPTVQACPATTAVTVKFILAPSEDAKLDPPVLGDVFPTVELIVVYVVGTVTVGLALFVTLNGTKPLHIPVVGKAAVRPSEIEPVPVPFE